MTRVRPVYIWWLGVALFTPSILVWDYTLSWSIPAKAFNCPFDWFCMRHVYLPLVAALIGFIFPLACLRLLRRVSWGVTSRAFATYLAIMVTWAVIDIRNENIQIGGHDYPHGPLVDGHRYYWHVYFTWYFVPYEWIERGIKD